ncbi:MAG: hypothetical protein WKF83_13205 [Nocardioidaceae bacterium]
MSRQREVIYAERRRVLEGEDLHGVGTPDDHRVSSMRTCPVLPRDSRGVGPGQAVDGAAYPLPDHPGRRRA